jgi:hypothetical protein
MTKNVFGVYDRPSADVKGGGAWPARLYEPVPAQMKWTDVAARVAREIAAGRWAEGEPLPGGEEARAGDRCSVSLDPGLATLVG